MRNWKQCLCKILRGQIRCIVGDVPVANRVRLATQQLCTCAMLFWKFLCRLCTTTTWKCLIKISRLLEDRDVNKWHQFSFSLPALWYNPLGFIKFLPEKFAKNLTKWMTCDKGDEVWNTVNSRFCCRCSIDDGNSSKNVTFKMNSRLFQFVKNVKFKRISPQLISWEPHSSLEREREIHCLVFVSFIKRENRHFHVVVVMHV